MKLLVAISWYYPARKSGGPAVSVSNLATLLGDDASFYVVTSDHDFGETAAYPGISKGWNRVGSAQVRYLPDAQINASELRRILCEVQPDCVLLNSLFGYRFTVPMLRLCRKMEIPVWLAPRGELCENAFDKALKKKVYIRLLSRFLRDRGTFYLSTSAEESEAIRKRIGKIPAERIARINNVPTIPEARPKAFPKQKGALRCVFLSRIQRKKNLLFALECLSGVDAQVIFDIYGPQEEPEYWKQCEEKIRTLPANIKVCYCGIAEKEQVHEIFSQYDVFLFPTLSENYGHVIVEALLSGCPVLISDQTPWEQLDDYGCGYALPLNHAQAFTEKLNAYAQMDDDRYRLCVEGCQKYTQAKLNLAELKENYLAVLQKISKSGKKRG